MKARLRTIPLGASGPGTTLLVPAPDATRQIIVVNYLVVMDGGGTYQFLSDSNAKSDAIPVEDKGGAAPQGTIEEPLIICNPGEALNIVGGVGTPKGHLTYAVRTP